MGIILIITLFFILGVLFYCLFDKDSLLNFIGGFISVIFGVIILILLVGMLSYNVDEASDFKKYEKQCQLFLSLDKGVSNKNILLIHEILNDLEDYNYTIKRTKRCYNNFMFLGFYSKNIALLPTFEAVCGEDSIYIKEIKEIK